MNFITVEYDCEDYDYLMNFESDHDPVFHDKHVYLVTKMFKDSFASIAVFNPISNIFYLYQKNHIFPFKPHVLNGFDFIHRKSTNEEIKQFIHAYKNYKSSNHTKNNFFF